jgi:hypothetical protein
MEGKAHPMREANDQEVYMMEERKQKREPKPNIAPGSEDLGEDATPEEIAQGNYTPVTRLVFDEVEPSP